MQLLGSGKCPGEHPDSASRECSRTQVSARTQHIPTITHTHNCTTVMCITGTLNSEVTQMLLDSGASCSVVSTKHIRVPEMSLGRIFNL